MKKRFTRNWNENPYKTSNGGYLDHPSDCFFNTEAKKQTKKIYRSIVARWGYCRRCWAGNCSAKWNSAMGSMLPQGLYILQLKYHTC